MHGWNGKILRIDLTKGKAVAEKFDADFAMSYLGGRGFAAKILWDELSPGVDALSPQNKLVFAAGPLTGFALPSSGKLLVAAKSPLTGGYGDGNMGTNATVQMRKAGYDAIVFDGKAKKPTIVLIEDEKTEFRDGKDFWGLGTFETERRLKKELGGLAGVVSIGPGGENGVKFANIISQEGRGGGRPGIGAVMGSKNLKAVAIKGSGELPAADPKKMKELGTEAYQEVLKKPNYDFWKRQGTMSTIEWSQENSVLPTFNYKEAVFDLASQIGGFAMEKIKTAQRGCPNCNMTCGNVVKDIEDLPSELDYENVAMLGSNIGLGDLKKVAALNRMADDYGVDTISLGNVIGFVMEAYEKKLIKEKIEWGDYDKARKLIEDIAFKRGFGATLANGVKFATEKIGGDSLNWAMQIKGLEISAYDCHAAPAMALAYATAASGAHHKDAWVISWEVKVGREDYSEAKVDKVIEFQRIRGAMFEGLVTCRLPWVEVGFELDWYPRFLKAATGMDMTMNDLFRIADRIYTLIRAFWVREYKDAWNSSMDTVPTRWFKDPLTKGNFKGAKLNKEKYEEMLKMYYKKRGWDNRGIPTKKTLTDLGLGDVAKTLSQYVKLTP
ncbi:MAG: aldehyde ferredoxin oxidoreductase family protein [Candidatus Bathyarchaeia archaeon]